MISMLRSLYHKYIEHPRCGKCETKLDYKADYGKWGCPEGCHPKHYPTNSK